MSLKQRIRSHPRVQAWINRRLKPVQQVTLGQRQIFIFLTAEGMLYVVLLLITFIAGINYANNLILGLCFFLGSVLVLCIHHTFAHLSGLQVSVVSASDGEAGGTSRYVIRLQATGSQPHRQIFLEWCDECRLLDEVLSPCDEHWDLPTTKRGEFVPERLTISTVYPLGLLRAWSYIRFDAPVWIAPKPLACALPIHQSAGAVDDEVVGQTAGIDEFDGLRAFELGESMGRVSWAHVARGQGMWSKQFVDQVGQTQTLNYQDMPSADHETKLSYMAYWVQRFEQQGQPFALRLPQSHLAQGQGSAHASAARRLLAEHP